MQILHCILAVAYCLPSSKSCFKPTHYIVKSILFGFAESAQTIAVFLNTSCKYKYMCSNFLDLDPNKSFSIHINRLISIDIKCQRP